MSIIYGPVPSWRLGKSLGIDMVSTQCKTCSFDCIYCQLGKTVNRQAFRQEFVPLLKLKEELESLSPMDIDYVTFSGVGEPTLASNIGEAIDLAAGILHVPIAVLTNASLLQQESLRSELSGADVVVAKLDAPDDRLLQIINRPVFSLSIQELLEGIRSFRSIFQGKLAIQMMFTQANRSKATLMAEIVKTLCPDEVQINTPLRPCPVKPLSPAIMTEIRGHFSEFSRVVTVYEASRPEVEALDREQTKRRRPEARLI